MIQILRHKKSNVPYERIGGDKFVNLLTGKEGEVDDQKAREVFVINVEASQIFMEYPIIKELIFKLKLIFDK